MCRDRQGSQMRPGQKPELIVLDAGPAYGIGPRSHG